MELSFSISNVKCFIDPCIETNGPLTFYGHDQSTIFSAIPSKANAGHHILENGV